MRAWSSKSRSESGRWSGWSGPMAARRGSTGWSGSSWRRRCRGGRVAADLRPEAPGDQVGGLVLGVVPALGLPARAAGGGIVVDGDQRLAVDEAGARVDVAEGVHRGDGGAGELDLELEAAAAGEGVEVGGVAAGPGEEGDLVDRAPEGDGVGLLAVVAGGGAGEGGEAVDEGGATRCRGRRASRSGGGPRSPACRSPRRRRASASSSRSRRRPGARLDQVPAQAVAHRCGCRGRRAGGSRPRRWRRGRCWR